MAGFTYGGGFSPMMSPKWGKKHGFLPKKSEFKEYGALAKQERELGRQGKQVAMQGIGDILSGKAQMSQAEAIRAGGARANRQFLGQTGRGSGSLASAFATGNNAINTAAAVAQSKRQDLLDRISLGNSVFQPMTPGARRQTTTTYRGGGGGGRYGGRTPQASFLRSGRHTGFTGLGTAPAYQSMTRPIR